MLAAASLGGEVGATLALLEGGSTLGLTSAAGLLLGDWLAVDAAVSTEFDGVVAVLLGDWALIDAPVSTGRDGAAVLLLGATAVAVGAGLEGEADTRLDGLELLVLATAFGEVGEVFVLAALVSWGGALTALVLVSATTAGLSAGALALGVLAGGEALDSVTLEGGVTDREAVFSDESMV